MKILLIVIIFGFTSVFPQNIINPKFEAKKHMPKRISSDGKTTTNRLRINYRYKDLSKFYGYVDLKGDTVIPVVFDYAERFKDDMAQVYINGYWGMIDTMGNFIVEPEYEGVSYLKNGISMFKKKYWGYFNSQFEPFIQESFIAAGEFKDDKALVMTKDSVIALINKQGNIIERFNPIPLISKNNDLFIKKDKVRILKPNKSYFSLRKYAEENLSVPGEDIHFMRWTPGMKTLSNGIQKLKYGCILWMEYGWESGTNYLRIPHISYNDGVILAFQIIGHNLRSFEISEKETTFKLYNEAGSTEFKVTQKEGYVEIYQHSET